MDSLDATVLMFFILILGIVASIIGSIVMFRHKQYKAFIFLVCLGALNTGFAKNVHGHVKEVQGLHRQMEEYEREKRFKQQEDVFRELFPNQVPKTPNYRNPNKSYVVRNHNNVDLELGNNCV